MIGLILVGATVLSTAAELTGLPKGLAGEVANLNFGPFMTIVALAMLYLVLGMFLDGISMVVVTLPVVMPIVLHAGYSPLWFGVFMVIMVELAQITPPVGFNIFVLQSLTGRSAVVDRARCISVFSYLVWICVATGIGPGTGNNPGPGNLARHQCKWSDWRGETVD